MYIGYCSWAMVYGDLTLVCSEGDSIEGETDDERKKDIERIAVTEIKNKASEMISIFTKGDSQ